MCSTTGNKLTLVVHWLPAKEFFIRCQSDSWDCMHFRICKLKLSNGYSCSFKSLNIHKRNARFCNCLCTSQLHGRHIWCRKKRWKQSSPMSWRSLTRNILHLHRYAKFPNSNGLVICIKEEKLMWHMLAGNQKSLNPNSAWSDGVQVAEQCNEIPEVETNRLLSSMNVIVFIAAKW